MTTIVVADDASMFRAIMSRYLKPLAINVLELESGKGVTKLVNSTHIDAIIVDIFMDEKEGLETIMELMELPKRPKIIAVSSSDVYLDHAVELGADAAITKPIAREQLENILRQLTLID